MANLGEFRAKTEVSAADRVSGKEFLSSATAWDDSDKTPVEFFDRQALTKQLLRHSTALRAIVVLARARALRVRQAITQPKETHDGVEHA